MSLESFLIYGDCFLTSIFDFSDFFATDEAGFFACFLAVLFAFLFLKIDLYYFGMADNGM